MDEFAIKVLGGLLRVALAAFGGWMVSNGWADASWANDLIGYSAIGATTVWTWVSKQWAEQTLDKAIAAPAGKAE